MLHIHITNKNTNDEKTTRAAPKMGRDRQVPAHGVGARRDRGVEITYAYAHFVPIPPFLSPRLSPVVVLLGFAVSQITVAAMKRLSISRISSTRLEYRVMPAGAPHTWHTGSDKIPHRRKEEGVVRELGFTIQTSLKICDCVCVP